MSTFSGRRRLERCVRAARTDRPAPSALSAMAAGLPIAAPASWHGLGSPSLAGSANAGASVSPVASSLVSKGVAATVAKLGAGALVAGAATWSAGHYLAAPSPAESPSMSPVAPALARKAPTAMRKEQEAPPPAPESAAAPAARSLPPSPAVAPELGAGKPRASSLPRAARVADEAELIDRARRALRDDPARALALSEAHGARHPSGLTAPERDVIAIEALLGLGQRDRALARFRRFEAAYPSSLHLPRLRRAVGAGSRSGSP